MSEDVTDEIDWVRAECWALLYSTASVRGSVVQVHPDIHGLYETMEAASLARRSKSHPDDYHITRVRWRVVKSPTPPGRAE